MSNSSRTRKLSNESPRTLDSLRIHNPIIQNIIYIIKGDTISQVKLTVTFIEDRVGRIVYFFDTFK